MTVYIITRGCYSDYEICAVSLDKDKAESLAKMYSTRYEEAFVETWETDTMTDVNALNGRLPYYVHFYPGGGHCVSKYNWDFQDFAEKIHTETDGAIRVNLYARDEEAAVKIASERRAQYLAEKEGIL